MAYQSGDTILDDHYNGFVASVNALWGTGSGDSGYGQGTTVSTVSPGTTITATQWATLLNRISSIASHQGTSITAISNPSVGNTIEAYTALSGNISTVTTNRLNVAGFGTATTGNTSGTGTWFTQTTHTITYSFASTNERRYFFNAGGELRVSFARSGGTSSAKNTNWTTLCTQCGTIVMDAQTTAKSGGSGTVNTIASSTGFYDLSTTDTVLFKQFEDTSPYTGNYIQVNAKTSGNNVVFTVIFRDDAADSTGFDKSVYNVLDQVDGTITTTSSIVPPSTTHISNTWGAPSTSGTNAQS